MRIAVPLIILWGLIIGAGCQTTAADSGIPLTMTPGPPFSPSQGDPQMTPSLPAAGDAGLQILINKAVADLAQRLSLPAAEIRVVDITPVVWSDSSLGCPQPGMEYPQVPVDGLLIRLQVGEQVYPYHSGGLRDPFLCETINKDPNPPPQIDIFDLTPDAKSTPSNSPAPDNSVPPGEDT